MCRYCKKNSHLTDSLRGLQGFFGFLILKSFRFLFSVRFQLVRYTQLSLPHETKIQINEN